ncbi:hypothetical protein SDJN02_13312, partial [Cucurbita argyrosperma subsp. argyrosperma]
MSHGDRLATRSSLGFVAKMSHGDRLATRSSLGFVAWLLSSMTKCFSFFSQISLIVDLISSSLLWLILGICGTHFVWLCEHHCQLSIVLDILSTLPSPNVRLDDGLRSLSKRPYLVPTCNYIGHFLKIKQISEVDYWILKRHFLDCCRSGT